MEFRYSTRLICLLFFLILSVSAYAQNDIPSYESNLSSAPADPGNDGPATTFTYDLLLNSNNPNGNTFSTVGTPITVTYIITAQPYNVSQDSDGDGDASDTDDNPASVMGWDFTSGTGFNRPGESEPILEPLNAIDQSLPSNQNFTSLKSVSFISPSPDGDGIDIVDNYGVFIDNSFEGLTFSDGFDDRHDLGTLTVEFSEPVDDPVLHFKGLGSNWAVAIQGLPGNSVRYYNTATVDLDFEPTVSTSGIGTPTVLSGTNNFVVTSKSSPDGGNRDVINNNTLNPDVDSDESFTGNPFAVAHGSVLFPGEDVSTIVFTMRARFMDLRDNEQAVSGTLGGVDYDVTVYGDTDGLGWSGGGTDTNNRNNTIGSLNFSSDSWGISASIPAPQDVTLTTDECFRLLSSPVRGATYDDLLSPIWTQGAGVTGADDPTGDPNVWTWPVGQPGNDPANWSPVSDLTSPIPSGTGFLVSVFADDDPNTAGGETWSDKLLNLEGGEYDPFTANAPDGQINSNANGWSLLGNPFKSPLAIADNAGSGGEGLFQGGAIRVNETVYIWDRNTENGDGGDNSSGDLPGSWITGSSDGSGDIFTDPDGEVTGNGTIAPFQGFFVQNTADGGLVSQVAFTDAMKVTSGPNFYGKQTQLQNFARFELRGESLFNSMWVKFSENGGMAQTVTDALELLPYSADYAIFGTEKSDETVYDVGHYPIPDSEFEIPVIIESTKAGSFVITASDVNLSLGTDLYFIDLQNEESILIDEYFSYEFQLGAVEKALGDESFNKCGLSAPQKAKTKSVNDRFLIAAQPREFIEIPSVVSLEQNYPNPFNPTTEITYQLPQQSDVRLEVFDLTGRQVATLVNEAKEAGVHQVNFNASNLSSGVYIYRLYAGSEVISRKLTVIK